MKKLKEQKGMATVETIPLLVLFLLLIGYGLGLWGSIHTAILYSIASRTYAFETFRNRTDLTYFRENERSVGMPLQLDSKGIRFHGIKSPETNEDRITATERSIAYAYTSKQIDPKVEVHNYDVFNLETRNSEGGVEVNPIWIMVGYGMCLNAGCGER